MTPLLRLPTRWKLLLGFLTFLPAVFAAPQPVNDFAKRPEIRSVAISEDGRSVTFLTPNKGDFYDLNLYDLETRETRKFDLSGDEVMDYHWIDATRLIVTTQHLPSYWYRQFVFDVKQQKATANLTYAYQYFELISSLRRDPNVFLVRFYNEHDFSGANAGVALIDTRRRPITLGGTLGDMRFNVKEWITLPKGELHGCIPDYDGELRFVLIFQNKKLHYHYRTGPADKWTELPLDPETTTVLGVSDTPDLIYVARYSDEKKSSSLHRYRVSTNDLGPAIFEDPVYSISDASLFTRRSPDGKIESLALGYDRDLYTQRPIKPAFAALQEAINKLLPGRLNTIQDCDYDLKHAIVSTTSGRDPARFLVYDRDSNHFMALPEPMPWFKPAECSIQKPIKFTARDGLTLEGYLSLPATPANGQKPPLVVYAHGGPWVRDTWGFDPEVQLLTSRGYAVFQPNYRGSNGYSKAVSFDDNFEFRKMHDDVTDGVRHLIKQGIIDEKRIAIVGASFGGYLSIAGVAFEPDLYRCAVTFAGVFDWEQLIQQRRDNRRDDRYNYEILIEKLGDPKTQQERFDAMSPLAHAAAIKAPVFVIHGKLDETVDYRQSKRLLAKLSEYHVPHEKLFFDTEFHGFYEQRNLEKYLAALEKFLAKNL